MTIAEGISGRKATKSSSREFIIRSFIKNNESILHEIVKTGLVINEVINKENLKNPLKPKGLKL
ncbi:hypothetical protein GCM10011312_17340 [Planktosalinus lacus]|uniref:Uncharacterized protein n=1 Tax=Planktosalinus lacus TaxID=1526573 RepID=A0A8J2Y718_9FLAO|nr:hypothetical protein GCM10011312_17340 [Planktosalinus lacus]